MENCPCFYLPEFPFITTHTNHRKRPVPRFPFWNRKSEMGNRFVPRFPFSDSETGDGRRLVIRFPFPGFKTKIDWPEDPRTYLDVCILCNKGINVVMLEKYPCKLPVFYVLMNSLKGLLFKVKLSWKSIIYVAITQTEAESCIVNLTIDVQRMHAVRFRFVKT